MRLLFILSMLTGHLVWGQANFSNAVDYNAFIAREQREVVKKNLHYISFAVHSQDYQLIEVKRRDVLRQIAMAKKRIAGMPSFEGDARLRDEAVEILSEYENAFSIKFKEVINRRKNSESSFKAMQAYFVAENSAEKQVVNATQKFNRAQTRFVEHHNLIFENDEEVDALTNEMIQITSLNLYLRNVFLEYFKVQAAFTEMLEVLYGQKSGVMEKKRKQVIAMAEEAIEGIKSYGPFEGHTSYRDQTLMLVKYYHDLAGEEFAQIVSLFKKRAGLNDDDIQYINNVLRDYEAEGEDLMQRLNAANNDLLLQYVSPKPSE